MTETSLEHLVYTFTIKLYHVKAFYFPYHNLVTQYILHVDLGMKQTHVHILL